MYTALVFALLGLSAPAQLPPLQVGQSDVPLLVSVDNVDADASTVQMHVTNQSTQPITAWAFEFTAHLADGHMSIFRFTQDFYPGLIFPRDKAPADESVLGPGATRVVTCPLSRFNVPVTRLSVKPAFVILDDQTSVGNPDRIQEVFAKRQRDLAALKEVATATRRTSPDLASLNRLDDDLTTPLAAEQRNSLGEQARTEIRHLINASRKGATSPDRSAKAIQDLMDRYVAVVERYATPKQ